MSSIASFDSIEVLAYGDDAKEALKRNAIDVKIVFESSRSDSHQDFADCGKAKSIPKSLVTTFDVRDKRNQRTRELVKNSPFLSAYVDATASNVNLSAKSKMIWSMSAVRMFVAHVVERHPNVNLSEDEKTQGAEEFFAALVRHLPQLRALDKARKEPKPDVTTGTLREMGGGDVALRGVGLAVFARAFLYCKEYGLDFDVMASKLARIDWHLLECERSELPSDPSFGSEVLKNAQPMWAHLLVIGDNRYRVSSSSTDADAAWEKICEKVLAESQVAGVEKEQRGAHRAPLWFDGSALACVLVDSPRIHALMRCALRASASAARLPFDDWRALVGYRR